MTSSPEKASSHDPLADLDDDLGDDWESAFQAEDFMFSPEDESADFFLSDDKGPEDSADLLESQDKNKTDQPGKNAPVSGPGSDTDTSGVLEFPGRLQILTASLLQLFQVRPLYQRLLISSLPLVLILIIVSSLFLRSSLDELASQDGQTKLAERSHIALVPQGQDPDSLAQQQEQTPSASPEQVVDVEVETIQQQWKLPTFLIVANDANKTNLIVNIDLTLIAYLEKGQSLPEDKKVFVKNIIYQFYANRPADELKRFSLARGAMISQLNAWLNKQWENNPFDTIIFSRYHVTRTPPAITPALTQKTTFM